MAITTVNMTDVDLTATERSGGAWSAPQTIGTGVRMQSGLPATGGNRFGAIAATWTRVGDQAVYATETPGDYTPPQPPQPQPDPAPAPETPPATGDQPPKTPAVLAPLPEARLAGRTIRIDARVTVKAKKRCKGTASARVKVGKRTFRGRLKLKTRAGACRATGTVRLAAAPAKKAKLRVTITAKVAKTRTLSVTR